jgi:hypothetical protein
MTTGSVHYKLKFVYFILIIHFQKRFFCYFKSFVDAINVAPRNNQEITRFAFDKILRMEL